MFGDTNQCEPVEKGSQIHYDYFKPVPIYEMCPKRIKMNYKEEHARYDPQTRDMFTKFLRTGNVNHQFEPRVPSYHSICYLNETRKNVTEECCNRFTQEQDYQELEFKYQDGREKYKIFAHASDTKSQRQRHVYYDEI